VELPEALVTARLGALAHDVAVALQNADLRQLVFNELSASPYREHKLHFAGFVRGRGAQLLERVAAVQRRTVNAALASLDSVADVEFYMPVPEHAAAWRGDTNLIVVAQLRDEATPVGFTLTGEPVLALSPDVPPATPALVLVPVETDFSQGPARAEECPECPPGGGGGGGGGGGSPSLASELWAIEMVLEDDGEGWPRGSPELVISTLRVFTNGTSETLRCANEEKASPYYFDAEAGWAGEVLVTPLSEFNPPGGGLTGIMIWENDDEGSLCAFSPTYSWEPVEAQMVRAQSGGYRADWQRVAQDNDGDGVVDAIKSFLETLASLVVLSEWIGNGDDVVGLVVLSGSASGFQDPKNIVRFLEDGLPSGNGWIKFQLR
jgi:hypothetical protein